MGPDAGGEQHEGGGASLSSRTSDFRRDASTMSLALASRIFSAEVNDT